MSGAVATGFSVRLLEQGAGDITCAALCAFECVSVGCVPYETHAHDGLISQSRILKLANIASATWNTGHQLTASMPPRKSDSFKKPSCQS